MRALEQLKTMEDRNRVLEERAVAAETRAREAEKWLMRLHVEMEDKFTSWKGQQATRPGGGLTPAGASRPHAGHAVFRRHSCDADEARQSPIPSERARGLTPARARSEGGFMARSLVPARDPDGVIGAPAQAQNPPIPLPPFLTPRGTPEDQRACRPDAVRLCKEVMDNDDAVLRCFQARRQQLSPACHGRAGEIRALSTPPLIARESGHRQCFAKAGPPRSAGTLREGV